MPPRQQVRKRRQNGSGQGQLREGMGLQADQTETHEGHIALAGFDLQISKPLVPGGIEIDAMSRDYHILVGFGQEGSDRADRIGEGRRSDGQLGMG